MLDHVSITVSDLRQAERFYDAVMAALGVQKVGSTDSWIGYGQRCDSEHPDLSYLAIKPGPPPGPTHGRHWCFKSPDRAAVDAFWKAGIGAGGADDGLPGLRPQYHAHYYAAFLLDPDGNRVEAVCHRAEA
ncbi:lyase [Alsobacter metallidurans]|uniref:Lyase n=1 Tax=Alsobacter metallidurans TaxID=340221 RepID=A0A917I880_9HYPH|nr:VOC family protein [Alsobacter metallidurans]GGH21668.1 lyase [Alsobacter metallidurans]